MKIRNNIHKSILSVSAVLLLSAVTAQGAFAMGSPTHTTDARHLGATTADVERSGSFRHVGGRVGWIADSGAKAGQPTAQADADNVLVALRIRGGM
jgi:hypothetical protein